ncbi:MAG: hypothetical protein ACLQUW_02470 [Desulfobaccales bacterium]
MSHHVIPFKVEVKDDEFTISFINHLTGAKMTLSGPIEGIFLDKDRRLEHSDAKLLADEIADVLRRVTSMETTRSR